VAIAGDVAELAEADKGMAEAGDEDGVSLQARREA
jgi:hypothetical protein